MDSNRMQRIRFRDRDAAVLLPQRRIPAGTAYRSVVFVTQGIPRRGYDAPGLRQMDRGLPTGSRPDHRNSRTRRRGQLGGAVAADALGSAPAPITSREVCGHSAGPR